MTLKSICLLLGCTHFPVLKKKIRAFLGVDIAIIDSAKVTAISVGETLERLKLKNTSQSSFIKFLITDLPERFIRISEIFLGYSIHSDFVKLIDINKHEKLLDLF